MLQNAKHTQPGRYNYATEAACHALETDTVQLVDFGGGGRTYYEEYVDPARYWGEQDEEARVVVRRAEGFWHVDNE